MITTKKSEQIANNIDEVTAKKVDLQHELKEAQIKLDAATAHMSTLAYKLAWDKLNAQYLNLFNIATKQDDAYKAKYALEQMKGVIYAKNIYVEIKRELANRIYEIEAILKEMQEA